MSTSSKLSHSEEPSLAQLQSDFLAWLQQGNNKIKQAISGANEKQIDKRLDIYAQSYRLRLIEALSDTFPACHTLVGDERFFSLANAYIDNNPSQHFSLRYFGHQLSSWIDNYPLSKEFPVITEMASFEWALRDAFDAQDKNIINLQDLQAIPAENWPNLKFELHPSVQIISLTWNVPQLWKVIDEDSDPIDIEKNDYPISWLIYRFQLQTFFHSLDVDEAWCLMQIQEQATFEYLCDGISEWVDEQHAPNRVATLIQNYLSQGLICSVYF